MTATVLKLVRLGDLWYVEYEGWLYCRSTEFFLCTDIDAWDKVMTISGKELAALEPHFPEAVGVFKQATSASLFAVEDLLSDLDPSPTVNVRRLPDDDENQGRTGKRAVQSILAGWSGV